MARNKGIDLATTKWITFIDADDWIEPEACHLLYEQAEAFDCDILFFGVRIWWKDQKFDQSFCTKEGVLLDKSDRDELQLQIISRHYSRFPTQGHTCGATWSKVYKCSFLLTHDLCYNPALRRSQDVVFNVTAFELANRVVYLDRYFYNYWKNIASAMNRYIENAEDYQMLVLREFQYHIVRYNKPVRFEMAYVTRCIHVIFSIIKSNHCNPDNPKPKRQKIAELYALLNSEPFNTALVRCNVTAFPIKIRIALIFLRKRLLVPFFHISRLALNRSRARIHS